MECYYMTETESKSLVWIRSLAMLSIVVCHLFQAYHNVWADVFNIGVQVFLVMSGYLYGYKVIDNWKDWGKKRIKKVYIPYLVFLILVIPFYALFHEEAMKWKVLPFYFVNLQGFRFLYGGAFARIEGLRHVWFITAIMCAYMATPFLQRLRKYSAVALPLLIATIAVAYFATPSLRYVFVLSWFYLYAIGYLFVNLENKWRSFYLVLAAIVILILFSSISGNDFLHPYDYRYRLIHDIVGVFVVIVGVYLLSLIKNLKTPKVIEILDKYSYYIFIVHFIIMCGPFSLSTVTSNTALNVIIMLSASALVTWLFSIIMNRLNSLLDKYLFIKISK